MFRLADRMDLREWKKKTKEERKERRFILDIPESPAIHHNHIVKSEQQDKLFANCSEDAMDLRPAKNSALIDKGVLVEGINDNYQGDAPDIGAYEYGGYYWTAGANWWPNGQEPPKTMAEASQRAHKMINSLRLYRKGHAVYKMQ